MSDGGQDRALEAFRRLLADGQTGGQAKVDALVALSQRTVFVACWEPQGDELRTLVNANHELALPVFTDVMELEKAAQRFGWHGGHDGCPHKELGARAAFRYALVHKVHYVVVDITSSHALEIQYTELEPLLATDSRSDSSGPFAAVGRISSTMLEAVQARPAEGTPALRAHEDIHAAPPPPPPIAGGARRTRPDTTHSYLEPVGEKRAPEPELPATGATAPRGPQQLGSPPTATYGVAPAPEPSTASYGAPTARGGAPTPPSPTGVPAAARPPSQQGLPAARAGAPTPPSPRAARAPSQQGLPAAPAKERTPTGGTKRPSIPVPDGDTRVTLWKVTEEPSDELLDSLTTFLRNYPEVEWAAYCMVSRGASGAEPAIGLRMDASFRKRADEIAEGLARAARQHGASVTALLLDDPQQIKQARTDGVAFFPWRR